MLRLVFFSGYEAEMFPINCYKNRHSQSILYIISTEIMIDQKGKGEKKPYT